MSSPLPRIDIQELWPEPLLFEDPEPDDRRPRILVAVAAGLVLGPLTLLAQQVLPGPTADLANSSAVWAAAAFTFGAGARRGGGGGGGGGGGRGGGGPPRRGAAVGSGKGGIGAGVGRASR
jgi:hypothetical protein